MPTDYATFTLLVRPGFRAENPKSILELEKQFPGLVIEEKEPGSAALSAAILSSGSRRIVRLAGKTSAQVTDSPKCHPTNDFVTCDGAVYEISHRRIACCHLDLHDRMHDQSQRHFTCSLPV
jgi:hypothetical protein